ncbi:GntR family transcriptional regulator [Paenibacillus swuensis]|uniref:GntR family transcriptional regulator n=1 Tax=Paenibacillus swuensis TaxID=1178515 RepID=A0A172TLQ1_9BACL|nr:GntR family transcriptional regulator [Paenibacillus swuensis]ANE47999.1 GntR family transcriptional regulator [Paenibacillus swuensis]
MININERSSSPIYEQIIQGMKELVLKGVLQNGEKLPSVREMSSTLLVNPNTVSKAYQELERQGVIETLRGKGTFVCTGGAPVLSDETLHRLKSSLKQVVLDASYAGVSAEQLKQWIDSYLKELRSGTNA